MRPRHYAAENGLDPEITARMEVRSASMRPRHYAAENSGCSRRCRKAFQQASRFNEAAALRRGKPPMVIRRRHLAETAQASMRPRHYAAENEIDYGALAMRRREGGASMRPRHYAAENPVFAPRMVTHVI